MSVIKIREYLKDESLSGREGNHHERGGIYGAPTFTPEEIARESFERNRERPSGVNYEFRPGIRYFLRRLLSR